MRWTALECAAIQYVLLVRIGLEKAESQQRKGDLDRNAVLLSQLGGRGYSLKEGFGEYGYIEFDPDTDLDPDVDFND